MNKHVDITTLGKNLWCTKCDLPISLRDVRHDNKYGVASILTVECLRCNILHKVPTFQAEENSPISFPVNLNIALGMIDHGLGETHINGLFAAANFQTISPAFLKKTERRVGKAIEKVAKESCLESIRLEKKETLANIQKESM
ncbi:PREDICTED: uncharacterized protein LOC108772893 [Cyphomyrmex costatus]|uniref:uncharacterized protein LOC108772893 n=1 Tax=Cyphomyrmex costatus TaxID=456900 RepID=UPI000852410F|nr:PREDICTED: uncharacterized protein LOC108772893 [Cyphomyrmex costatus]